MSSFFTWPSELSTKRTSPCTTLQGTTSPESLSMKQYSQRSGQAVLMAILKRRISLLVSSPSETAGSDDSSVDIQVLEHGIVLDRLDHGEQAVRERLGHGVEVIEQRARVLLGVLGVEVHA